MRINELKLDNFRNLTDGVLKPAVGVNILYGDNAQGKTNVLEACWLFTGGKSFRGARDGEMVAFQKEKAMLSMSFEAEGRMQEATITIGHRRQATLNGIPQRSPTALTGRFCAVVFCPAHLQLVSGARELRRRFMDAAICQLRPGYIRLLGAFSRVLTQRNTLLKAIRSGDPVAGAVSAKDKLSLLDVWDAQMAAAAAKITASRARYLARIAPLAEEIYGGLSGGKEALSLSLETPVQPEPPQDSAAIAAQYTALLRTARRADIAAGFSTVGAHREDIAVCIDGAAAKAFASQGQQRSAVLALKLAEASLLREVTGEQPVALLDDVMSELDVMRQDYILNHIHDWQVLMTCCDPVATERQTGGKVFHIQNGNIR